MGAVIAHVIPDNTEWPTAYASRTLSSPDSNYVQINSEGGSKSCVWGNEFS